MRFRRLFSTDARPLVRLCLIVRPVVTAFTRIATQVTRPTSPNPISVIRLRPCLLEPWSRRLRTVVIRSTRQTVEWELKPELFVVASRNSSGILAHQKKKKKKKKKKSRKIDKKEASNRVILSHVLRANCYLFVSTSFRSRVPFNPAGILTIHRNTF